MTTCASSSLLALQIFLEAIRLFLEERQDDVGAAVFDKDDDLAVEFVTAAANLRSIAYNIPTQSLFAAKVGPLTCKPASDIWIAQHWGNYHDQPLIDSLYLPSSCCLARGSSFGCVVCHIFFSTCRLIHLLSSPPIFFSACLILILSAPNMQSCRTPSWPPRALLAYPNTDTAHITCIPDAQLQLHLSRCHTHSGLHLVLCRQCAQL